MLGRRSVLGSEKMTMDISATEIREDAERVASNFRSMLNDLKRRPEDAARELGMDLDDVNGILSGGRPLTEDVVHRALAAWPVSARDFYLLRDDAPQGVKIMRSAESAASSRVMTRAGRDYYEYRDTVMSASAAFRPEWIRELCFVDDNDPENELVQWNNGHFLHQFTYFIGPVNFYYRDSLGQKRVAQMNTGDSMYIAPFVPHTFTTRKNPGNEHGLILALTYGNNLSGDTQQELSLLDLDQADALALDFTTSPRASGQLIRFHREGLSMPQSHLAQEIGKAPEDVARIEAGEVSLDGELLSAIARALGVGERDLLATGSGEDSVQILADADARRWPMNAAAGSSAYDIVELCRAPQLPFSKALKIDIRAARQEYSTTLRTGLHQFIYNIGTIPVATQWTVHGERQQDVLDPNDSMYLKPGVEHSFAGAGASLLVLRIGGRVGGDSLHELSTVGRAYLPRILGETMQWFNPKGKNG